MDDHTRQQVRAIVLAGHTGDAPAAEAALADTEPAVRAAALGALQRAGALRADALLAGLADPHPTVRTRAAAIAATRPEFGDRTGPVLVELTERDDDTLVEAAAFALGELPATAPAVAALARLATSHPEVVVRETAVAALGSLAAGEALPAVLAATTDVATVRRRAVLALAAFDGDEVEAALERLAGDRDRQVRQAAEDLLHGWGETTA